MSKAGGEVPEKGRNAGRGTAGGFDQESSAFLKGNVEAVLRAGEQKGGEFGKGGLVTDEDDHSGRIKRVEGKQDLIRGGELEFETANGGRAVDGEGKDLGGLPGTVETGRENVIDRKREGAEVLGDNDKTLAAALGEGTSGIVGPAVGITDLGNGVADEKEAHGNVLNQA